jgi:DNA repair protein RecN (Recombination protein N)
MLARLRIRHLAIIEDLVLSPGPGLTLLTGETGAGKSIIVDALGLVTGGRADSETVRSGEKAAIVEAVFEAVPNTVRAWAERVGVEVEDGTLILRREAGADGRSRAFAGATAVPVAALREVGELLVDLHGQHQSLTLLKPSTHLDCLDRFGGLDVPRAAVAAACDALRDAREALATFSSRLASRSERLDLLRFQERELAAADPQSEEEEALHAERSRLTHAGRIATQAGSIAELLSQEEGSCLDRVGRARQALEELSTLDPSLAPLLDRLDEARFALEDVADAARERQDVEADPTRLEVVESRLACLESLGRKHGGVAELPAALRRLREELAELEAGEQSADAAQRLVEESARAYLAVASALSEARREAAGGLALALERELAGLAFGRVWIEVALEHRREEGSPVRLAGEPLAVTPAGFDGAEILFSSNAGELPRPLARVASGGELARVLLALNVLLGEGPGGSGVWAPTVVFDEVDSGVGGRTAEAVGERLARLGSRRQVLCVTHLPQVACRASAHWRIAKVERQGRTVVLAERLEEPERIEEIARMIAGRTVSDAARRHARELIALAAGPGGSPQRGGPAQAPRRKAGSDTVS